MKSHIFPKFLLKQWILNSWNEDNRFNTLYTIDLCSQKYTSTVIDSKEKIDKILNNNKVFYLNFENNWISDYAKEWNENTKHHFIIYIDHF